MKLRILSFCVIILFLTYSLGCFTLPKKEFPGKKYYALEVARNDAPLTAKKDAILSIRNLKISSPYEQKEFIYRIGHSEFISDFYNEFLGLPNILVTEQLRAWFYNAGLFQNIALPNSYITATHILEGNITLLYADFRNSNLLQACSEIQFSLIDDTRTETDVVFQKSYERKITINTKSPADLISGWNQGFQEIFSELELDLSQFSLP